MLSILCIVSFADGLVDWLKFWLTGLVARSFVRSQIFT